MYMQTKGKCMNLKLGSKWVHFKLRTERGKCWTWAHLKLLFKKYNGFGDTFKNLKVKGLILKLWVLGIYFKTSMV